MKYPRTLHLSFSQEVHFDDKTLSPDIEKSFLNKYLIITEKLDGGNTCLHNGKVYARSHSEETIHPSFSKVKALYSNIFYQKSFDFERYMLFGENLQALHSIYYDSLNSTFYLFAVFDSLNRVWLSWEDVENIARELDIKIVPVIARMSFKSRKDMNQYLCSQLALPSIFGNSKEGFVLRDPSEIKEEEFANFVCKFVRKNHVQSDDHWSKNWTENKIIF